MDGIIHSTDDLIEATGDYRGFFAKMIESGDFTDLSRMHSKNLSNAVKSMKDGVTRIVIDNTCLRVREMSDYIKAALELGYSDDNIQIVDIDSGLSAEELAERNTHGVPLDKIKQMMQTKKSVGVITLEMVVKYINNGKRKTAGGFNVRYIEIGNILYSCILLDEESKDKIIKEIGDKIPITFKIICHHMTITLGEMKDKSEFGKEIVLTVTRLGLSDMAMAVQVEGYESKNAIPHITIAINPEGGKPVMSNDITKWQDIKEFTIQGVVTEIKKGK